MEQTFFEIGSTDSFPQKDYPIKPLIFWRLSSPLQSVTSMFSTLKEYNFNTWFRFEIFLCRARVKKYTHYMCIKTLNEISQVLDVQYYGFNVDCFVPDYSDIVNSFFHQIIEK